MGVAGAGKTTIGKLLAEQLGWMFVDADDFHSAANIEKISQGTALDESDREPWLEAIRTARCGIGVFGATARLSREAGYRTGSEVRLPERKRGIDFSATAFAARPFRQPASPGQSIRYTRRARRRHYRPSGKVTGRYSCGNPYATRPDVGLRAVQGRHHGSRGGWGVVVCDAT